MKLLIERLVQVFFMALLFAAVAYSTLQPNPNCPTKCGNLTIEYPFGTSPDCYHDESFLITCNQTETEQKPLLRRGNIEVLSISLDGELRVLINSSRACYNNKGYRIDYADFTVQLTHFALSDKNKITIVGCDSYGYLNNMGVRNSTAGCMAFCNSSPPNDGLCSGDGCCQTSIPVGANNFTVKPYSFHNHTNVARFNPCSYAFLAEVGSFNFSASEDLLNLRNTTRFPVLIDWSIGDQTCEQIGNINSCRENSICNTFPNRSGYTCKCEKGFEGNPYLQYGCKDVDECKKGDHTCGKQEICHNTYGSFHCKKRQELSIILLGSVVVFLVFLLGACGVKLKLENQKRTKLRENHFEKNGGFMIGQLLSAESSNVIEIYTEEEIKIATNGFHESRIIGKGGQGIVYKGILRNNSQVAIKKAQIGDSDQAAQFINEVIVLSRTTDLKVVKLLGCCLETEVPFLVYEFVSGGTLSENLHGSKFGFLPWKDRLRIAVEIATTLTSLHSARVPIIHRDVKPTNILLDDKLSVKLADFGASRLVPADKEELSTLVLGTFGYLDPEYLHTRTFSEKSDVYSFGVVLMELVSGEKALCFDRPQSQENLVTRLVSALKENRLDQLIDNRVVNAVNHMEIQEAALLAVRCTRVKGEERPKMKEVAAELEGLRALVKPRFSRSVSGFENEGNK